MDVKVVNSMSENTTGSLSNYNFGLAGILKALESKLLNGASLTVRIDGKDMMITCGEIMFGRRERTWHIADTYIVYIVSSPDSSEVWTIKYSPLSFSLSERIKEAIYSLKDPESLFALVGEVVKTVDQAVKKKGE